MRPLRTRPLLSPREVDDLVLAVWAVVLSAALAVPVVALVLLCLP